MLVEVGAKGATSVADGLDPSLLVGLCTEVTPEFVVTQGYNAFAW